MSSFPLPDLPPYLTLLLTGALSPSYPVHLALAHLASLGETATRSKVIIVTARGQDAFDRRLRGYDDAWLNQNSMKGAWASLLASIDIFYAASPGHLMLILSLLRPSSVPNSRLPGAPPKAVLNVMPSLVILHDVSLWFANGGTPSSYVMSDYLNVIASGLDCARYLNVLQEGNSQTGLAVIDERLSRLRLPVVSKAVKSKSSGSTAGPSSDDVHHEVDQRPVGGEALLPIVAKYFEWVGEVEKEPTPDLPVDEDHASSSSSVHTHTMTLRRFIQLTDVPPELPEEHVFRWREDRSSPTEFNGMKATTITHLNGDE